MRPLINKGVAFTMVNCVFPSAAEANGPLFTSPASNPRYLLQTVANLLDTASKIVTLIRASISTNAGILVSITTSSLIYL